MNSAWFLNISEYGVPTGCATDTIRTLYTILEAIDRNCKQKERQHIQLATFGPCDLLTLHFVPDIRYLATAEVVAEVNHQRAVGAVVPDVTKPATSPLRFLKPDGRRPIYLVANVKLEPLAKLLTDYTLGPALIRKLEAILKPKSNADDSEPPTRPPGGIDITCLPGLDTAELVILARAQTLDELALMCWRLQNIRLGEVLPAWGLDSMGDQAKALAQAILPDVAAQDIANLRVIAYMASTLGIPIDLLQNPRAYELGLEEIALSSGVLLTRTANPLGRDPNTQRIKEVLSDIQSSTSEGSAPSRVAMFGTHGTLLFSRPDGETTSQKAVTLGQLIELLKVVVGLVDADSDVGHRRPSNNTLVGVTLAEGDTQDLLPQDARLKATFEKRLADTRRAWLGGGCSPAGAYRALQNGAKAGGWAYSRTNAGLNLLFNLTTLLTRSAEFENYIDLLPILRHWVVDASMALRPENRAAMESAFKHLDRMLRLRQGRDRTDRAPRLSRSTEARAGYIVPRDAFLLFIQDLTRRRVPHGNPDVPDDGPGPELREPMLVDGADPQLKVKFALDTGLFYVSAQRLVEPILWPSVVHEVEHVRLEYSDNSVLNRLREKLETPETEHGKLANRRGGVPAAVGSQLEEILCDLALFDGPALLGGDLSDAPRDHHHRFHRFLITMFPNLVMDMHDAHHGRLQTGNDNAIKLLQNLALSLGVRLLSVWILSRTACGEAVDTDDNTQTMRRTLEDASSWWNDVLVQLLEKILRCSIREQNPVVEAHRKRALTAARGAVEAYLRPYGDYDFVAEWSAALTELHKVRSPDRNTEPMPTSLRVIYAYLERLRQQLGGKEESFSLPPVSPRGGLDPKSELGCYQQAQLWVLFEPLQAAMWAPRAHTLRKFISGRELEELENHCADTPTTFPS